MTNPAEKRAVLLAHGPVEEPHKCPRCGEPNPEYEDRDGCRDPDCPEQGAES